MITDLKINEENKKRYYEQGYWTEKTVNDIWNDRVAAHPDREYISETWVCALPTPKSTIRLRVLLHGCVNRHPER